MLTSFYERFMPLDDLGHGMFSCSTLAKNSVGNLQEVTAIAAHTHMLTHTATVFSCCKLKPNKNKKLPAKLFYRAAVKLFKCHNNNKTLSET